MIAEAPQPEPKKPASTKHKGGKGRPFTKGGPGGPGNPFAAKIAEYRAELYATIDRKAVGCVARKLLAAAKAGEGWAIKELLDRVLGKATQPVDLQADGKNVTYEFTLRIGENEVQP